MPLNEADTRAQLIDPKLESAGWGATQIGREHYYRRDVQYTAGRIVLRGERAYHRDARKVDYLLRYTEGFPIAVVEAKAESEEPEAGLEQAKDYARDLAVPFAYATNGHHIVEYDFFARCSTELNAFPGPALYPSMSQEAQEVWIEVRDSLHGSRRGLVILRPVDLYGLERLILSKNQRAKTAFARQLAFGRDARLSVAGP